MVNMLPPIPTVLSAIIPGVYTSYTLGKIASTYSDDAALRDMALDLKVKVNAEIFNKISSASHVKTAGVPSVLRTLGKGALLGAGVTVPGVIAGNYLLNKAEDNTVHTIDRVKQNLLLTGAAILTAGLGAYGLGRATSKAPAVDSPAAAARTPVQHATPGATHSKTSAVAEFAEITDNLVKLAAVGNLDEKLRRIPLDTLSKTAQHDLLALQALNQDYGVQLLLDAMENG